MSEELIKKTEEAVKDMQDLFEVMAKLKKEQQELRVELLDKMAKGEPVKQDYFNNEIAGVMLDIRLQKLLEVAERLKATIDEKVKKDA